MISPYPHLTMETVMIATVDEGIALYKEALLAYWNGISRHSKRHGRNFRCAFNMSEDLQHAFELKALEGMEKALGLTEEEIQLCCRELGVEYR